MLAQTNEQEVLRVVNDEAWALMSSEENYERVEMLLDSTLKIALVKQYKRIEEDCYSQLSSLYQRQDKLSFALKFAQKALSLRRQLRLITKEGDSHNNLGLIHKKLGDLDSAVFHFQKGLAIWHKEGDKSVIALLENNLADALYHKGEFENALKIANSSLETRLELGEQKAIANTQMCLGNIYLAIGAFDSARSQYVQILNYAREAKQIPLEVKALSCLIGLALESDTIEEARLYLGEVSIRIDENNGHYQIEYEDITRLLFQRALFLQKQGDLENALKYLKGIAAFSSKENLRNQAFAFTSLGELFLQTEGYDSASFYLQKGLEQVQEGDQNVLHRRILNDFAYLNARKGDYAEAFKFSQSEDSLTDLLNSELRGAESLHFNTNLALIEQADEKERTTIKRYFFFAILFIVLLGFIFFYRQRLEEGKRKAEIEKQKTELEQKKLEIETLIARNKTDSILAMVKGGEEERAKISSQLHNEIGNLFTLAQYPFEQGYEGLTEDGWHKLKQNFGEIQEKVRSISHQNSQTVLAQRYFADTIEELCTKTTKNSNLEVNPTFSFNDQRLSLDVRAKLHSIISELLNNAVKYSQAKSIEVNITDFDDSLNVMVIDNGKGFDFNKKVQTGKGLGILQTMVESMEGTCSYDTSIGNGTTVNIEIPLIEEND